MPIVPSYFGSRCFVSLVSEYVLGWITLRIPPMLELDKLDNRILNFLVDEIYIRFWTSGQSCISLDFGELGIE